MEAKAIFNACRHLQSVVAWEGVDHNEWSYIGASGEFQMQKAEQAIRTFFGSADLFLAADRRRAFALPSTSAAPIVARELSSGDVMLCDAAFSKAMLFSHIGVMKHGHVRG